MYLSASDGAGLGFVVGSAHANARNHRNPEQAKDAERLEPNGDGVGTQAVTSCVMDTQHSRWIERT
jgi:hypothetical protein